MRGGNYRAMFENILSLILRMVAMLEINGGKVNLSVYSGTSRERNTVNSPQRKEIDMTGFTNVCKCLLLFILRFSLLLSKNMS